MLVGFLARPFFTADGGTSGSGTTSAPPATGGEPGVQTPAGGATGQTPGSATGDDKIAADKPPEKLFSQADLDAKIAARLAEEKDRETRRTEAATRKTKEDTLREQGEWKTLAEQRELELAPLQGANERAESYAKALNDVIKDQIADWPEEVKALDPGKDNLEARLAWVKSARPLAERLKQAPKAPDTEAGAGNRRPAEAAPASGAQPTAPYRFQGKGDISW